MSAERPADAVRVSAARCPFCHEEVQRGVEPAVCIACHALHHVECMAEQGACSACGAAHPRFAPVARPPVVASPRPRQELSVPRAVGRLVGHVASRRGLLALFALVAIAAIAVVLEGRVKLQVLLATVALGSSLVGAAGTAFVDARRGLGAACLSSAAGLALVLSVSQHVPPDLREARLPVAAALSIAGALLLFWPTRRR